MRHENVRAAAEVAEAWGAFARKDAQPQGSSRSTLGRIARTVAAVKLGTRVLPLAWRLFKRYPVISFVVVGAMVVVSSSRARATVPRRTSSESIRP